MITISFDRGIRFNLFQSFNNSCKAFQILVKPFFEFDILNVKSQDSDFLNFCKEFFISSLGQYIFQFNYKKSFSTDFINLVEELIVLLTSNNAFSDFTNNLTTALKNYTETKNLNCFSSVRESNKKSNNSKKNIFDNLESLFLLCCQFFFVFILPKPFFLTLYKNQKSKVGSKHQVMEILNDKKQFFLTQFGYFFPTIQICFFFDMAFLKIKQFCEHRFELWRCFSDQEDYDKSKMQKISSFSSHRNKKREFMIETRNDHLRNVSPNEEVFFINGYLSKEEDNAVYFYESFHAFNESTIKLVNWNSASIESILFSSAILSSFYTVLFIPLFELELILLPVLGILSTTATSIPSLFLSTYKNAEKNSKIQGEKFYLHLLEKNRVKSTMMDFLCFSLGSEFIFSFLKGIIKDRAPLLVRNVIIIGGVLCQKDIIERINELVGIDGVIRGRLILVNCHNDEVLSFVVRFIFKKSPVGYDHFNYIDAAKTLMKQSELFNNLGFEKSKRYLESKIRQVDVTHFVNGHLDYKNKFGTVTNLVYPHLI